MAFNRRIITMASLSFPWRSFIQIDRIRLRDWVKAWHLKKAKKFLVKMNSVLIKYNTSCFLPLPRLGIEETFREGGGGGGGWGISCFNDLGAIFSKSSRDIRLTV